MKIIDNFLPEEELKELQDVMMGPDFPWYYNNCVAFKEVVPSPYEYSFTHMFFWATTQSKYNEMVFFKKN